MRTAPKKVKNSILQRKVENITKSLIASNYINNKPKKVKNSVDL